jgi:hypothetical protein
MDEQTQGLHATHRRNDREQSAYGSAVSKAANSAVKAGFLVKPDAKLIKASAKRPLSGNELRQVMFRKSWPAPASQHVTRIADGGGAVADSTDARQLAAGEQVDGALAADRGGQQHPHRSDRG